MNRFRLRGGEIQPTPVTPIIVRTERQERPFSEVGALHLLCIFLYPVSVSFLSLSVFQLTCMIILIITIVPSTFAYRVACTGSTFGPSHEADSRRCKASGVLSTFGRAADSPLEKVMHLEYNWMIDGDELTGTMAKRFHGPDTKRAKADVWMDYN